MNVDGIGAEVNLDEQPVFVIEYSSMGGSDILKEAVKLYSSGVMKQIKHEKVCASRWRVSKPLIYVMEPCMVQVYLARNMNQAHYQLERVFVSKLKTAVKCLNKRSKKEVVKIVEISGTTKEFFDEYLFVMNNPISESLKRLDSTRIADELNGRDPDSVRNNIFVDYGYAGTRNSRREPKFMGLTHSMAHSGSDKEWVQRVFVASTDCLDELFPKLREELYCDKERNSFWASCIARGNRIEALRLGKTNASSALLKLHWDLGNCRTPKYAWVATISWWVGTSKCERYAITTYGKDLAETFMAQLDLHKAALTTLRNLYESMPDLMKSNSSVILPTRKSRREYPFAFLDKSVFYSSFVSGIRRVFDKYPCLKNDLVMACSLWINIIMSETPDHFWQICEEICLNSDSVAGVCIKSADPIDYGYAFSQEIFRRKRHSGNDEAEIAVSYPTKQRHAPTVNRPPSREHIRVGVDSLVALVKESRLKIQWNLANAFHYYGKSCQFLVEDLYGAGHLTAQHLLGVGTGLGLLPSCYFRVAEVGQSTRTWKFFKWAFGYNDCSCTEDMTVLLRAASVNLGITALQAEELCCALCKIAAPSNSDYDLVPCCVDFTVHTFGDMRSRFGDVVYRSMKLYSIDASDVLRCVDCTGKSTIAGKLVVEGVFSEAMYSRQTVFWARKFKARSSFHYRRTPCSSKLVDIREYFAEEQQLWEARKKQSRAWDIIGEYAAEEVARLLLGPSYESVTTNGAAREPLNLKQLVWNSVGHSGQYKKKAMFHTEKRTMWLQRPPPFNRVLAFARRWRYYSCAVRVGDDGLYWPNPYFEMYPCGKNGKLEPDPGVSISVDYTFNYCRVLGSEDRRGCRRWFYNEEDAMRYAIWDFFFNRIHLFPEVHPQVGSLLFLGNDRRSGSYKKSKVERNRLVVQGVEEVHVYFDTLGQRSKTQKTPFVIAVRYPKGGMAYYFCNEWGQRTSGAYLRYPLGCSQRGDGGTKFEFLCIAGHVGGAERRVRYSRSPLNLLIKWRGGGVVTEEPLTRIFDDCPMEVLRYAEEQQLLGDPGWAKVKKMSVAIASRKVACSPEIPHVIASPEVDCSPPKTSEATRVADRNRLGTYPNGATKRMSIAEKDIATTRKVRRVTFSL